MVSGLWGEVFFANFLGDFAFVVGGEVVFGHETQELDAALQFGLRGAKFVEQPTPDRLLFYDRRIGFF